MAAPITHIVLASKVFDKYFANKDPKKFYVGTSFPDIRYLGVIDRKETHFYNLSINDVIKDDSFNAGLKFHSLVDEVREHYMVENKVYDMFDVPNNDPWIRHSSLKVLEDHLLYEKVINWNNYVSYFNKILEGELLFGVSVDMLEKWHLIIKEYIRNKKASEFLLSLGFDSERVYVFESLIDELKSNRQVYNTIFNLYNTFEDLLE